MTDKKEGFRVFGFSSSGKIFIFCLLIFAFGVLVGRESVFFQVRFGIRSLLGG